MDLVKSAELVSIKLLSPHRWTKNPLKVTTHTLYAITLLVTISSGVKTAMLYASLPASDKILEYPLRKLNVFAEMGMTPPPLSPTIINGLLYHDVGIQFRSILFLLLIPVAAHIITVLLEFWMVGIKAAMSFSQVTDPRDASYAFAVPKYGSGQPCF